MYITGDLICLLEYVLTSRFCLLLEAAFHQLAWILQGLATLFGSLTPLLGSAYRPAAYIAHLGRVALEAMILYSSMLLLSGRALLLRKSLSTNGRLAVNMFTNYFLKFTIALVIECSKMNFRTSRLIRDASERARHFMHVLLVLPLSFLQIINLLSILFDFFRRVFKAFFNVMNVVFFYAILIFKTYKMFVTCSASIFRSVYYTSFYSILMIRSGLACLDAFTAMLRSTSLRRMLISHKEQKRRRFSSRRK